MKNLLKFLVVVVALAILTLTLEPVRNRLGFMDRELPVIGKVPEFALTGDDGRPFEDDALEGRLWIASFLYTSCPGPCPRLVERLKTVRRQTSPETLRFVSFSVDPEKDTPAVLTEYKQKQGIEAADSWTFVTGPSAEVLELVQKGFLTGVGAGEAGSEEGAVAHGTRVALVDEQRRIRAFYSTESDEDLERLLADVAALAD